MSRLKTIGKCLSYVGVGLCAAFLALFAYTAIAKALGNPLPRIFGWGQAVVVSGSMEPEIPVGALVLIREQDSYQSGDVVTYLNDSGNLVTHRLVSLSDGTAVTKGDANNAEDFPVQAERILGRVRLVLPGVGTLIRWLQSPVGICLILLLSGMLIFFPGRSRRKVEEHDDKDKAI